MKTVLTLAMAPLLLLAVSACSHGYSEDMRSSSSSTHSDTGITTYDGGPHNTIVMPDERTNN